MKFISFIMLIPLGFLMLPFFAFVQNHLVQSGYAPVNGLEIYYEIYGEGEPLVLLHGSFMTINSSYGALIPELAKSNKVIAVELQGHGRTADIDRPFTYPNFADDVAGLLDHLGFDKATILGYSLGATVGLQLAVSHPQKVNKIVFISSVYKSDGWIPSVRESFANMKPEFLTNTPLKTEYDRIAPDKTDWNEFISKMIAFLNTPFDLGLNTIKELKHPILIINGDYDGVDISHSMDLFKAFDGGGSGVMEPLSESQFAVVPGTTHVTLMMQTETLLSMISSFLETN